MKISPAWAAILALAAVPLAAGVAVAKTCNTAERSVLLILDASGSMNGRLPSGESRIEVAQRAMKDVASLIPGEAQLALRLYGSQSPRDARNCDDTNVAVPFRPAAAGAAAITTAVDGVKAQGWTPIALSLGQAAGDFAADAKERVIVLVSDGKETCSGDPTLAARELAGKGVTVHTVGFIVDKAARMQLQAIAKATGGSYFDAPVGPELPKTLAAALNACRQKVAALPAKPKPGKLRTTSAVYGLPILDAQTGKEVAKLDRMTLEAKLPAGIYEVRFGPGSWKGIEVRPGETTIIEPGELRLEPTVGAKVFDTETGAEHGSFDRVSPAVTLLPGVYDIRFGAAEWRFVKVEGGEVTTLHPVTVKLGAGLKWEKARVVTADGTEVARFDAVTSEAVLPPGDYVVEVDDSKVPFPASEGDVLELKPQ
jgi:hypothetical protein